MLLSSPAVARSMGAAFGMIVTPALFARPKADLAADAHQNGVAK
jgi:hypothetical protein